MYFSKVEFLYKRFFAQSQATAIAQSLPLQETGLTFFFLNPTVPMIFSMFPSEIGGNDWDGLEDVFVLRGITFLDTDVPAALNPESQRE